MSLLYPGDGTRIDTATGKVTVIADEAKKLAESKKKPSLKKKSSITDGMTPAQEQAYNEFQRLKNKSRLAEAQAETKKYGYGKKLPTKNKM
jgi:hypothetical protein